MFWRVKWLINVNLQIWEDTLVRRDEFDCKEFGKRFNWG
jgi:hypothetical protein